MIPPLPRRCGEVPHNARERVEDALAYLFEVNDHEGDGYCGHDDESPERVICRRCVARNALLSAGWTLNALEESMEAAHGFLGSRELPVMQIASDA